MTGYMMGTDRRQLTINSLEDMVGEESMVRVIDRFIDTVDLSELGFNKVKPAETGRPGYSPQALCKLYVYGYENGIRSSRKLERETRRNIEAMWLMDSLTPDYKTISEFRRENIRPLQKLFREFVKLCKSWDLIGGEVIAIDGSKIKASNNKKNNYSRKKIENRLKYIDEQIKIYFEEIETADKTEGGESAESSENIWRLQQLLENKERYESYKRTLDESGGNEISVVDPDARLMGNSRGGVEIAYNVQSAVDSKHGIVVAYDVSLNAADQGQLSPMAKKVKRVLRIRRFTALADKGYYTGEDLSKAKKLKVKAIVARPKPSRYKDRNKDYWPEKFNYDKGTDTYTCPMGQKLKKTSRKDSMRQRYSNKAACADCPYKEDCIMDKRAYREMSRNEYSDIFDEADNRFNENQELYKRRQEIVEHPFGTIKQSMNGRYFLLRTRRKVRVEVALLFLGYNLKRVVNVLSFKEIMARLNAFSIHYFRFFIKKWVSRPIWPFYPLFYSSLFLVL